MKEFDQKFRKLCIENISQLIELIIKRKDRFRNLPFAIFDHFQNNLSYYSSKLDVDQKEKILNAIIESAKDSVTLSILPDPRSYPRPYLKVLSEFDNWLKDQKEIIRDNSKPSFDVIERNKIVPILNKIVPGRLPEFIFDKKVSEKNTVVAFSRKLRKNLELLLKFDLGTQRGFTYVSLGVKEPKFRIEIGTLYGADPITFSQQNEREVERETNRALDHVEFILPSFSDAILSAYEKVSTN